MKYYITFAITFAITFLFIYIILSYYNTPLTCADCEGFTPKVRQAFRPYFRDTKSYTEGFYNNTKNRVHRFLRNIGLF